MFLAIFISLLIIWALGQATRTRRHGGLIARHQYNNLYSDATAAREDHLG